MIGIKYNHEGESLTESVGIDVPAAQARWEEFTKAAVELIKQKRVESGQFRMSEYMELMEQHLTPEEILFTACRFTADGMLELSAEGEEQCNCPECRAEREN